MWENNTLEIISAAAQAMTAVAGFVLSWAVWRGSKKLAKTEYMISVQESWVNANISILENPEIARASDVVLGIGRGEKDDEFYRNRYLSFLYLNIIEASFLGSRAGLVNSGYHDEIAKDLLVNMLRNYEVVDQLERGGSSVDFVKYCKRLVELDSIENGKDVPVGPNTEAPGLG